MTIKKCVDKCPYQMAPFNTALDELINNTGDIKS